MWSLERQTAALLSLLEVARSHQPPANLRAAFHDRAEDFDALSCRTVLHDDDALASALAKVEPRTTQSMHALKTSTVRDRGSAEAQELHARAAAKGVIGSVIAPRIATTNFGCTCCPELVSDSILIGGHLVDEALAIICLPTSSGRVHLLSDETRVVTEWNKYTSSIRRSSHSRFDEPAKRLTSRQRCILRELARGKSDCEIARMVGVTDRTVRKDVAHIYALFGVQSRFELGCAYTAIATARR